MTTSIPALDAPPRMHGNTVFTLTGFLFLMLAFVLLLMCAVLMYISARHGMIWEMLKLSENGFVNDKMGEREAIKFVAQLIAVCLPPVIMLFSAGLSMFMGFKLLKISGVTSRQVIPAKEYELLAPAIRDGNDKAITEYIRLASLTGFTATFTKFGLTGLPLATIFLTIILAVLGLFKKEFFDLAQLTLGAFIGSFVTRRNQKDTDPA